jgi:ubiquinone/menaquinone biosynthesis C-methylase UbiE
MRALTRLEQRIVPGQREHAGRVIPYLLPYVKPGMRVLDFGNGSGAITHGLAEASGASVVGVDVAQNSLFPAPVVAYDGTSLPFRDGTFDLVYSVFVVHHCPDV